ncbi:MAG TPA: PfkB family carbohydrate kinase, partial [Allocoleopsis sp.]
EAPVLILRHEHTNQVPGGGANAVYNLAKLGANVKVVGLIGDDLQGQSLKKIFEDANINTQGIFIDPQRPTVTKTRISGHSRQSVTQQIVRIDRKSDQLPDHNIQLQLADYIQSQINQVDAVVCSDYNEGVFTDPVIQAALLHKLIIVDSQKHINRYQGATIFTPNLPEAEQEVGYSLTTSESLLKGGKDLLHITQSKQMLITRGDEGMSLFDIHGNIDHIPAFNRTDVFDVTGAGDTVVSALTLGLCAGASPMEAAILGNLAASIVVRQFGTATTTPDEMKSALLTLLESQ